MSDLYVLDTNIYIHALRNAGALQELKQFLIRAGTRVRFDGVVGMELHASARSPAHEHEVKALLAPYRLRGWTTAPSFNACSEAGRILAALQFTRCGGRRSISSTLVRDAQLAASCQEAGAVLITTNGADFRIIQRHLRGFRYLAPWPLLDRRA